jgi:lactate dehydrogenase-like 2-hydroxyacid dehydrogenase
LSEPAETGGAPAKRLLVTQRLFDDTVARAFEGSSIHVDVRQDDEPLPSADLGELLRGYHGVISLLTDRLDASVLRANPQLEVVANVAVGYDNIDVAEATRLGITVTNTPDVLTETTADLTVALMLAVARRIPEADAFARSGDWTSWKLQPAQLGVDLHGKTLGLFGMGRIGRAVARRAVHGFGMRLMYTSRSRLAPEQESALEATYVPFDELLRSSDVISLHAPLTAQTRHVIGPAELAAMRPTAILVNTARGPLVDEAALAEALVAGHLWGAGLDVFEAEPRIEPRLASLRERVVLAPHLGSATAETRQRMADMAARNARAVLEGRPADHPVTA